MTFKDPEFPSSAAFDLMHQGITSDEERKKKYLKQANAVVQFDIKNSAGKVQSWYLEAKKTGEVGKGKSPTKPDVTLIVTDADFQNLIDGKANAQKLFMSGKLKVKGNVMKATSLEPILKAARTEAKL